MNDWLEFFTPAEAGAILKIKVRTILDLCASGRMPAFKAGRQWRIPKAGLEEWVRDSIRPKPEPSPRWTPPPSARRPPEVDSEAHRILFRRLPRPASSRPSEVDSEDLRILRRRLPPPAPEPEPPYHQVLDRRIAERAKAKKKDSKQRRTSRNAQPNEGDKSDGDH
jgi:excisionase family DNA binding protein